MFGKKNKKAAPKESDGNAFLTEARTEHAELYHDYIQRESGYDELAELLSDLEEDAWQIVERVVKQSYRNGINRGRRGQRTSS